MSAKTQRVWLHIRPTGFKRVTQDGITRSIASDFVVDRMTKGGVNGTGLGELAVAVDIKLDPAIFAQLAIHAEVEITPENAVVLMPFIEAEVTVAVPEEEPHAN